MKTYIFIIDTEERGSCNPCMGHGNDIREAWKDAVRRENESMIQDDEKIEDIEYDAIHKNQIMATIEFNAILPLVIDCGGEYEL